MGVRNDNISWVPHKILPLILGMKWDRFFHRKSFTLFCISSLITSALVLIKRSNIFTTFMCSTKLLTGQMCWLTYVMTLNSKTQYWVVKAVLILSTHCRFSLLLQEFFQVKMVFSYYLLFHSFINFTHPNKHILSTSFHFYFFSSYFFLLYFIPHPNKA